MRAVVVERFGSLENASLRDLPDPIPGPDDVLVEVLAVAVNFADTLLIRGIYQFRPEPPFIPGKLPAGVVRAVGANVAWPAAGERVLAITEYGGYGNLVVVPATRCIRIPQSMSYSDAASMSSVYDTALMALRDRARFQPGDTVLVVGATGGVGLAAIQLVKALRGRTLAVLTNPAKSHLARDAGADAVIDLSAPGSSNGLRGQVLAATGGRGADVVLDMLGGDFLEAALGATAWRGRLVVIGFASGRIAELPADLLVTNGISVAGIQISDYRRNAPEMTAACFAELFSLYEKRSITSLPTTNAPLERFADALRAVVDRTARGRIVLLPSG